MEFGDAFEEPALPIEQLLPLRCLTVVLQFTGSSNPKFFHQASLAAFVRHLLREPEDFDTLIRIESHESGRTEFSPGDFYTFRLFGLAGSEALMAQLDRALHDLPASALRRERRICFRDNLRLVELRDGLSDEVISGVDQLSRFDAEDLARAVADWQALDPSSIEINFTAPVRLLKDKAQRMNSRGESRYCHDHNDLDSELLINRVRDSFADLLRRRGAEQLPPRSAPPSMCTTSHHLFWLESIYSDPSSHDRGMGGLCGTLAIQAAQRLPASWWELLVLGQFTGIGQRTSQGWGRYVIDRRQNPTAWLVRWVSHGPLEQVMGEKNLLSAYFATLFVQQELDKLLEAPLPSPDSQLAESPVPQLRQRLEQLLAGTGEVRPCSPVRAREIDATLQMPCFEDRVLEQAIAQILLPRLALLKFNRHRAGDINLQSAADQIGLHKRLSDSAQFAATAAAAARADANQVRNHLTSLFGEDPLFDYIEAALAAEGGGINIASPLCALIGPPIGLPAVIEQIWVDDGPQRRGHSPRRPDIRVRNRSPHTLRRHLG